MGSFVTPDGFGITLTRTNDREVGNECASNLDRREDRRILTVPYERFGRSEIQTSRQALLFT